MSTNTTYRVAGGSRDRRDSVHRAVEGWVRQLIDMTGRNQLLYYRDLPVGTLDLGTADPSALDALLGGQKVRLSALFRPSPTRPQALGDACKRAQTLHRKSVELFEERGIETLFLADGMATWTSRTSASTPNAPVVLRPLELKPRGAGEADFDVILGGDWSVNEALLHLLHTEFRVPVDGEALLSRATDAAAPGDVVARALTDVARDVASFRIAPRRVVGTFLYTRLPMVRDLQAAVDALAEHDLIAALAGVEEARQAVKAAHARDVDASLPDRTPVADEFLVLDADASQHRAVNAVLAGESLVIQGPPGTGKSQTIANLIATLTARGKRVLFVAEKRAAIEAVVKRLDAVGLGDLVLDLHGGVTSKRQLAQEIAATLTQMRATAQPRLDQVHREVESSRQQLNTYVAALHTERSPWAVSLWDVQERLLGLGGGPAGFITFTSAQLPLLDASAAETARASLRDYADLVVPFATGTSPWRGATVTSDEHVAATADVVTRLADALLPAARVQLDRVTEEVGLPAPASIAAWRPVLETLAGVRSTLQRVDVELYDDDLDALGADLAAASKSAVARWSAQLFNAAYRRAKKRVGARWHAPDKPSAQDLLGLVTDAAQQRQNWQAARGSGSPKVPSNFEGAAEAYERLSDGLAELAAFHPSVHLAARALPDVEATVARLRADQPNLYRLPRLAQLRAWLTSHACSALVQQADEGAVADDQLVSRFDHAWLSAIRTHILATEPAVGAFDAQMHSRRVGEFLRADEQHLATTPARVRRAVAERAYALRNAYPKQSDVIEAEARKRRGHLGLRKLMEQAPDVLTALRPCWVMSPLVVAQTMPARQVFDVVIFDEASQIRPADAVSALLRASRAVIAGDDRQMPPTSFFDAADDDDDDDIDEDDTALVRGFESILDVLGVLLRPYMLTWHYRSRDERLIAFSNAEFYGGALTTFPGVGIDGCITQQLVDHHPGERIDTRSNDREVAAAVEHMVQHARTRPAESLGLIAMGQHHASRVEAALRQRLRDERDPALDGFFDESREERAFVKNLERVQGDEREAILISFGYGKQSDGRLLFRFGPLLGEHGGRRLNVAVSRARSRLTVLSSFSHTDLERSSGAPGERIDQLRRYLKFVESGGADLETSAPEVPLNAFELSVLKHLEQDGLKVRPQYGTSGFRIDFAICHPTRPGRFVLAVEADGAAYHSSPTARDRDRLRQTVLEGLGWRFHRIWSTHWFNDQDAEFARLKQAYHEAVALDGGNHEAPAAAAPTPPAAPAAHAPRGRRPIVAYGPPITQYGTGDLDAMIEWIQSDTLLRTDEELLAELMRELGFSKRGARIVQAMEAAIGRWRGHSQGRRPG